MKQIFSKNTQTQRMGSETLLLLLVRFALAVILIFASYDKILDPGGFAKIIYNYRILPENIITVAAIFLPWFEFILGAFLIFGVWMEGTVLMVNILFITFTAAIAVNVARGVNIDCGCFGAGSDITNDMQTALFRDVIILFSCIYLYVRLIISKRLENQPLRFP